MAIHPALRACVAAFAVALLPAAPAAAQEADPSPAIDAEEEVDVSRIEQILRGEERVLRGERFTYDPAGRRDPFRSLLESKAEDEEVAKRPPGLAGTMIEELKVQGIVETAGGVVAFAQGRDNLSYLLRPGTKLYNGEVMDVQDQKVIFRQYVTDPKALKPYREVVRDLSTR